MDLSEEGCQDLIRTLCLRRDWTVRSGDGGVPIVLLTSEGRCAAVGTRWTNLFENLYDAATGRVGARLPLDFLDWARRCSSVEEFAFMIGVA